MSDSFENGQSHPPIPEAVDFTSLSVDDLFETDAAWDITDTDAYIPTESLTPPEPSDDSDFQYFD